MEHITRNVIVDLWPLYASGEASPDTKALVDAFLREDPEFEETLRELDPEPVPESGRAHPTTT